MDPEYQQALIEGQYSELLRRIESDEWKDVASDRDGLLIYVRLEGNPNRPAAKYLARIDATRYPVHPYWIGFLNPNLPRSEWARALDRDPRHWPFSFFPGLQGSFNIIFNGPHRTFWCRPCTVEYFYYHGNEVWDSARWTLPEVVAYLRKAVRDAEHPAHWRLLQRANLLEFAKALKIDLPDGAGLGDA